MKGNFPVQNPVPGIYLTCVDPEDCRNTLFVNGAHNPRPVIYGVKTFPPGFVRHDSRTCPIPRVNTFQTLEEFYNQDFLQTFTDCLKKSDFSTRGAETMGFSSAGFFEGSLVSSGGQRVQANLLGATVEYPYECCMQPSFYIANVRGLQSNTPYYNPLFTTVHDFNCFPENGCFSGGSIKNVQGNQQENVLETPYDFPKASPRSVMWYMQHAIATVEINGADVNFWDGGNIGTINAIGGILDHGGGLEQVVRLIAPSTKNLGGNAALFHAIKHSFGATDTPSEAAQKSYGVLSCPTTVIAPGQTTNESWVSSLLYPEPDNWYFSGTVSLGELECCTRGTDYTLAPPGSVIEGGQGIIPQNLSSFLVNSKNQTLGNFIPQTESALTCTNYHCFESPYCQSLLKLACDNFSTDTTPPKTYGGYCTRWRNWASNNYAPIQPGQRTASSYPRNSNVKNPPSTLNPSAAAYPSGAYMSSVDQSVFSLVDACSRTDFSHPQPMEVVDQCRGLLSVSTQQTTFPRLRPLTFDTPIQYSHEVVTPYTVDSSNNQIDIYLTYTQLNYTTSNPSSQASNDPVNFINRLVNRNANQGTTLYQSVNPIASYNITPQIENVVSFSINLDNIISLNSTSFFQKVQTNFNLQMAKYNGNFGQVFVTTSQQKIVIPPVQDWYNRPTPHFIPINVAKTNHYLASISWTGNSITVADILINTRDKDDTTNCETGIGESEYENRLENLYFLYDPRRVIWNSSVDFSSQALPGAMDQPTEAAFQTECHYYQTFETVSRCDKIRVPQNNFQGFVFDQASNLVDVLNTVSNLDRVDDRFTIVFHPSLGSFLGLGAQGNSVTINLNPLKGGTLNFIGATKIPITTGTVTTFSQYLGPNNPDAPITPFNLINHAEFWLTNTTPIPIYSLSVLNYSGNTLTVTLDPPSNPSTPLQPGSSVTVGITDPSDPDNTGLFSATPLLFYDAGVGGWQNNFQSPDFPVLGGFLSARGINVSTQNSYGNGERFGSFSADATLDFGEDFQGTISTILTYYANQNVYTTGEANSGGVAAISQMFLAPLI